MSDEILSTVEEYEIDFLAKLCHSCMEKEIDFEKALIRYIDEEDMAKRLYLAISIIFKD